MNRNATTVIVVTALVLGMLALTSCGERAPAKPKVADTLPWHRTLDDALAAAQKDHSLVVADVYADWCYWCTKLDEDTFTDPKVQEKLRQFVLLKLDAVKYKAVAQRLGVEGFPTTLILDDKGEVKACQPGFMPPEQYIAFLERAKPAK